MADALDSWLALTPEEVPDPDLPICDPHHHLWDYPDNLLPAEVPVFARQMRHYLLEQVLADTSGGHNIRQTVFIECNSMYNPAAPAAVRPVGETEFVQGIAAQSASGLYGTTLIASSIVGFADLTLGSAVAPVLEAHLSAARSRFRGIRHISAFDASGQIGSRVKIPDLLAEPKFREGFAYLQKYHLSFDAWLYHTQLPGLTALARAFPDTTVILDHIGGPLAIGPYAAERPKVFQDWKKAISALAECPNVFVKLGGLGMPLTGFGWHERPAPPGSAELAAAMAPYFSWCIEKFGPRRCMFESNFPVDKRSYSYTVLWNAFKRFAAAFSSSEKAALFHDTAARVYRLKV